MAAMRQPTQDPAEDAIRRFRANLRHLVDLYGVPEAARYSGITDQGVRNILNAKRMPGLATALDIWTSLGADPSDMFSDPAAFRRKITRESLSPFFVQRAPSSPPSSLPSQAARGRRAQSAGRRANINGATRTLHLVPSDQRVHPAHERTYPLRVAS